MRTVIPVPGRPVNPGYSHLTSGAGLLFVAGQVGDDADGNVVEGGIAAQAAQAFANVDTVLAAGGATADDVLMLTVYVTDPSFRDAARAARFSAYADPRPACTYLVVAGLASPDYLIEVEAVATAPAS